LLTQFLFLRTVL